MFTFLAILGVFYLGALAYQWSLTSNTFVAFCISESATALYQRAAALLKRFRP